MKSTYRYKPLTEPLVFWAFVDDYMARRKDLKPKTINLMVDARLAISQVWDKNTDMRLVTPGDADDLYIGLKDRYSPNWASRTMRYAHQFFEAAFRKRLILYNPFRGIDTPEVVDSAKVFFVTREVIDHVIANSEKPLALALAFARYGGLRCPSELRTLRWEHFQHDRFMVQSHKTEWRRTKPYRWVPLYPELRRFIPENHPKTGVLWKDMNPKWVFGRLTAKLKRLGIKPWPKLLPNLRASRQTELVSQFPLHVVCEWMGNSAIVAIKHYLQVTEEHYKAASEGWTKMTP